MTDRDPTSAAEGAQSPAQVPPQGWLDIGRSVWTKVEKNRVFAVSAGLTFYGILAIFPTVTALISIYGLFSDPAIIQKQLMDMSGVLPEGAISIIGDQAQRIAAQGQSTLSLAFVTGLAIALWSANAGVKALFDALNVAYEAEETRGFFRLNMVSLLFLMIAVAVILIGLSSILVAPSFIGKGYEGASLAAAISRAVGVVIAIGAALVLLAVLYRFGPATTTPHWRWVTPGSLFAVIFLIISSSAFSYYAAHFGSYNKTYGTLGAAIGFMTWLWISAIVIMVGAEINAEVEREAKGRTPAADRSESGRA